MQFIQSSWFSKRTSSACDGSVSNDHNPSKKLGLSACVSYRITIVIHVNTSHQMNCNCFNEPFAVLPYRSVCWDMHGLIFETSIWLLAGSTRYACCNFAAEYFDFTETRLQTRVTPKSCIESEFNMFAVHFFNNSSWTWTPQEHLHRYLLTHSTFQQAL